MSAAYEPDGSSTSSSQLNSQMMKYSRMTRREKDARGHHVAAKRAKSEALRAARECGLVKMLGDVSEKFGDRGVG